MYHHHHQPSYNPYAAPDPPQYASQYGGTWQPEQLQPNGSMNADTFSSGFQRSASYGPQFQPYQQYAYPQSAPPQQHHHHHAPTPNAAAPPPFQRHDSHQDPSWYSSGRSARRTSVQQRWDDYINSEACTDAMQADSSYINQVTAELETRALSDERLNRQQQAAASQPPTPGCAPGASPDFLAAQAVERERRLKWAQDMIINSPALCAEVYFAMSKPPASAAAGTGGAAASARSPGAASTGGRSSSAESMGSRTSSYSNSPT
ncbi:hypothetical protein BC567DRAFT_73504 [Phyllosticta citribraziliensis]